MLRLYILKAQSHTKHMNVTLKTKSQKLAASTVSQKSKAPYSRGEKRNAKALLQHFKRGKMQEQGHLNVYERCKTQPGRQKGYEEPEDDGYAYENQVDPDKNQRSEGRTKTHDHESTSGERLPCPGVQQNGYFESDDNNNHCVGQQPNADESTDVTLGSHQVILKQHDASHKNENALNGR